LKNSINKKIIVQLILYFILCCCKNKSLEESIIDSSDTIEGNDFLSEIRELDLPGDEYIRSEDFKEDLNPYNFDVCPGPKLFDPMTDCIHPEVVANCQNGWCKIPPGCFLLGSPPDEPARGAYDETLTPVTLTHPFEIMDHEVTQGEWESAGFPNPSRFGPNGSGECSSSDCPLENITLFEIMAYANQLSIIHNPPFEPCYRLISCKGEMGSGMLCESFEVTAETIYECEGYRLPTAAEWEYAARAGTKTAFYSGPIYAPTVDYPDECRGSDPCLEKIAWYCVNSGYHTHPIKQKDPNNWGLYDMLGNVFEWVNDQIDGLGYGGLPITDPIGPEGHPNRRALKGGSVIAMAALCRSAAFFEAGLDSRGEGFRLARTIH